MPPILDAVRARATLSEISDRLLTAWGTNRGRITWHRFVVSRVAQACLAREAPVMVQNRGPEATAVTEAADRDLTHEIIGSAIEVHRVLGPGLLESVYEAALCHEILLRGLQVERQVVVPVAYKGLELHAGIRLDLRIARRVVVEVKSVERLHQIHRAQLLTYLKLTGLRTGLLFNFNVEFLRNGMRRIVNG